MGLELDILMMQLCNHSADLRLAGCCCPSGEAPRISITIPYSSRSAVVKRQVFFVDLDFAADFLRVLLTPFPHLSVPAFSPALTERF